MAAHTARRASAVVAEPLADVLVSGGDESPGRPARTLRRAAVVLAVVAAVGLAVTVPGSWSRTATDAAASVELALRDEAVALLRRDGPPVWDLVHGGVHVEVVNEGRAPVRLVRAALSPGEWHVAVADDPGRSVDPGGPGRLLRPGWDAVLVLHRAVRCTSGADHGATPTGLVLEVEVAGWTGTRRLDVRRADARGLRKVFGSPEQFCAPTAGTAAPGSVRGPGALFHELWRRGTGVVRSP